MRQKIITYSLCSLFAGALLSCSQVVDRFEGDTRAYNGAPGKIEELKAESLPGKIKLEWKVPEDSSYQYLRVKFYDHAKKEDVTKIMSVYSNELLIDQALERYGDYTFKFQAFNGLHQGGEVVEVAAKSGKAPVLDKLIATKLELTVAQLTANSIATDQGTLAGAIDNDVNTYFHTKWGDVPENTPPHYLQVELKEPLTNFQIMFQNTPTKSSLHSKSVDIQVSVDATAWTTLKNLSGTIPVGNTPFYTEEIVSETPFKYLRWSVNSSSASKGVAWAVGSFVVFKITHDVFDPEALP